MNNPVIWADVPDVDVIRVGDLYYMTSTSMHMMPGVPIMRSTDLLNWELVSHVYDTLEDNDAHNLLNGRNIYGKGSWATSLRYHNGVYHVCFVAWDTGRTYVYRTTDIEHGPWHRSVLEGVCHDPSLLFDDDGRVYIVHGNGEIRVRELTADATAHKPGGVDMAILHTVSPDNILNCEGAHIHKIGGMYYILFISWPRNGRRIQWCYRSKELLGPYEGRIVLDDNLGYVRDHGVAQGGIVDTPEGDWYGLLFQDHDAVGRVPVLVPVEWTDGWPIMGIDGKVPSVISTPLPTSIEGTRLLVSDGFDGPNLGSTWQWNHNPDNSMWSLIEHPGHLRLRTAGIVGNVLQARNTLTQRTLGPTCSGEVELWVGDMKPGDWAGIAAFQNMYGMIGVHAEPDGSRHIVMAVNGGDGDPKRIASVPLDRDRVYLRIAFDFSDSRDKAFLYFSYDGVAWVRLGDPLSMRYTLDHFMGYRIALFNYATLSVGGHVDFGHFTAHAPFDGPWEGGCAWVR